MNGGLSNAPPCLIIEISTSIPKISCNSFRKPLNLASPACILPVSIACNIVRSFAELGLGVLKYWFISESNLSPDTLNAISISDVGFAVPFARLPCTTISPLISPTLSLSSFEALLNCSCEIP